MRLAWHSCSLSQSLALAITGHFSFVIVMGARSVRVTVSFGLSLLMFFLWFFGDWLRPVARLERLIAPCTLNQEGEGRGQVASRKRHTP